ncbi:MAG TPA: HoxN/HupN/NixA family nickel/cobalt transporter [Stellaceae bacterium]|nr:HoxN/HupN/NixA family nickel/cobalt transporter [Stellaceae bacterium]
MFVRPGMRRHIAGLYALLAAANIGAWFWAWAAFRHDPALLGMAFLAYGFGLRHAVDADHIAAIDNVTRKLMQEGKRPAAVGLFFSLGHSTIVVLASLALAAATTLFKGRLALARSLGGLVGTAASALFLLVLAVVNLVILCTLYRSFRRVKEGRPCAEEDLNRLLAGRGLLARLFRPLFGLVRHSWHMYPIGVLFGLGFDTATEIGLLGLAAAQAAHGLSTGSILIFPTLFTAGMSWVDTTDGILMLGAYGWAFAQPIRKLYYNLTITAVSVAAALFVGGVEVLGLAADRFALKGPLWDWIGTLNDHLGAIGTVLIALCVASWAVSAALSRARGYGRRDA